jgi:hypothetical protein
VLALVATAVVVAGLGAALAATYRSRSNDTTTTTSRRTGAPSSVSNTKPVIDDIRATATGADLYWRDDGWPGAAHVLILYSSQGVETRDTAGSPQPLEYTGKPKYCFAVAVADHQERRSDPKCINAAQPDQLVPGL